MCLAIYKPLGVDVSVDHLRSGFNYNDDGAGLAWSDGSKLTVKRGFFQFDPFLATYEENKDWPMLIHFRIKTHGAIKKEHCHPFPFGRGENKFAAIHNGILPIKTGPGESDTEAFVNKVIAPAALTWGVDIIKDGLFQYLIEETIGSGNKIVIMGHDGEAKIFNEDKGEWADEVWYSNGSYKYKTSRGVVCTYVSCSSVERNVGDVVDGCTWALDGNSNNGYQQFAWGHWEDAEGHHRGWRKDGPEPIRRHTTWVMQRTDVDGVTVAGHWEDDDGNVTDYSGKILVEASPPVESSDDDVHDFWPYSWSNDSGAHGRFVKRKTEKRGNRRNHSRRMTKWTANDEQPPGWSLSADECVKKMICPYCWESLGDIPVWTAWDGECCFCNRSLPTNFPMTPADTCDDPPGTEYIPFCEHCDTDLTELVTSHDKDDRECLAEGFCCFCGMALDIVTPAPEAGVVATEEI